MRNAVAHFDEDFTDEKPARKKAPARSASGKSRSKRKKPGNSRFRFDVDMQRVARYAAIGMSATVAIGIMVNALMMQKGRHPAPLFGTSIAIGENAPNRAPPKAPPQAPDAEVEKQVQAAPPPPRQAMHADVPAPTSDDAIGRLLQGGSIPTDHADQKTVLGAQRALAKLGFALKPTGTFGPQTKKAIERFEKDHHLPVKGDLNRRTLKVLATESGLKIER